MSNQLIKKVEDEFPDLPLIAFNQSLMGMSEPTKDYEKLILEAKIQDANPIMAWMISNVEIKIDVNGNYKPIKPQRHTSSARIDGVISSIMALNRALYSKEGKEPEVILNPFDSWASKTKENTEGVKINKRTNPFDIWATQMRTK